MKKHINHFNSKAGPRNSALGFTLIELLVVIAIIGLLASVITASLNSARDKAKVARAASDLKQLVLALNFYLDDNGGLYPCFDHNWADTRETAWSAPYLVWPTHPWGNQYHWEHGQQGFTFSISMNAPGQASAQGLDDLVDDGNLSTGILRGSGIRLEYGGMDQSVTFIDCHI